MIKVRVRLFGTLPRVVSGYDPKKGLWVELPDGATVKELRAALGIPEHYKTVATVEGRILKPDQSISPNSEVSLLQAASGG